MKTNIHFLSYLARFFLEWEMFQANVVEKRKKHMSVFTIFFFFFENSAIYEKMWSNIIQWGRPQMTIQRMCISR